MAGIFQVDLANIRCIILIVIRYPESNYKVIHVWTLSFMNIQSG